MSRRSLGLTAAMLAGAVTASAAGQVFKTTVDGVAVDVLVTRDRRPVSGLTAADFTLHDNGVGQQIKSAMLEDVPVTLLLVLDTSASVQGALLAHLKSAARAVVAALRPVDRVGLLAFSHRVRLVVEPPASASALYPHLDALEADGDTSIYDATLAALTVRERVPGRTLMLVFSDGQDSTSWLKPHDVLAAAQRSDVVVHAVIVGPFSGAGTLPVPDGGLRRQFDQEPYLFNTVYLWRLAEDTGGAVQQATSGTLQDAFVRVVNEFRSRYVLTYVPQGVPENGWHDVEVKVRGRGMRVQARRGYLR